MKAYKTPSGKWRVKVYLGETNGKKKWKSVTAKTKQEALRQAALFKPVSAEDITLAEACEDYMEIKANVVSPSTLRGYSKIYRSHIEQEAMAVLKLNRIDSIIVQRWISNLARSLSPKTVRNCYGFLTAVLSMYAPDISLRVKLPQRKPQELYTPTTSDINAVLSVAGEELKKAVLLGATAMMRRGEICALTAEDIDFERNLITIKHSLVKSPSDGLVMKAPKTDSSFRTIEVNAEVIALLPRQGKTVSLNPDQISMQFNRAVKKANVHPFRFHDLRHYAASIAVSSAIGAGSLTVQDRGGWNSDSVMKRVYTHSISDQAKKDTGKILDFFSKSIKFS